MKINKIIFDSKNSITNLCRIGSTYNTDKSPLCNNSLRHSYTVLYDFLFNPIKYNTIKLAEIGVWENGGIKTLKDFFFNAEIHGFEKINTIIEEAKKDNIPNTYYYFMDCEHPDTIRTSFEESGGEFDIIIDDGSHVFDHQINLIINSIPFLKPGGVLIVEDIFKSIPEDKFNDKLEPIKKYFDSISFIETEHELQHTGHWNNDKLLIMFRNNLKL